MKNLVYLFMFLLMVSCQEQKKEDGNTKLTKVIKVGVFDKNGDSPYCIADAVEALEIDPEIDAQVISAADIMSGITNELDVILFPGGSGRAETSSLGDLGMEKVQQFVKQDGKGVIGICAGAYILSETPDYPSLDMSAAEAIDIEHDHRGHGLAMFSLTEEGKKVFPELAQREISYSLYYEGPVLIPAKDSKYTYNELATMESDVHTVEGTPANMTNNRPFLLTAKVEKGMTASVVGHPESTQGMRWIIPRLARLITGNELVSYPDNVVRPDIHTQEILMTSGMLQKQREARNKLGGTKEEKLQAMKDIVDMRAWSAKKYIPQMIRDKDFEVRLLAAQLTVELERTDAIKDLEAAVLIESEANQKALLQEQLDMLKAIRF